jgi:hypothetical protein
MPRARRGVGNGGGHVRDRDIGKVDRLSVKSVCRGGLRRCRGAGYGQVVHGGKRGRIGDRIEFRLHHIRAAVIDTGADGEDERYHRQAHHHGHGPAFVVAEAAELAD